MLVSWSAVRTKLWWASAVENVLHQIFAQVCHTYIKDAFFRSLINSNWFPQLCIPICEDLPTSLWAIQPCTRAELEWKIRYITTSKKHSRPFDNIWLVAFYINLQCINPIVICRDNIVLYHYWCDYALGMVWLLCIFYRLRERDCYYSELFTYNNMVALQLTMYRKCITPWAQYPKNAVSADFILVSAYDTSGTSRRKQSRFDPNGFLFWILWQWAIVGPRLRWSSRGTLPCWIGTRETRPKYQAREW